MNTLFENRINVNLDKRAKNRREQLKQNNSNNINKNNNVVFPIKNKIKSSDDVNYKLFYVECLCKKTSISFEIIHFIMKECCHVDFFSYNRNKDEYYAKYNSDFSFKMTIDEINDKTFISIYNIKSTNKDMKCYNSLITNFKHSIILLNTTN